MEKQKNTELYKRLRDYFQLSSIQAHEVLASYKEDNILENLTYVEEKIKEGKVRTIGAYTLKAIKEDYRFQKNLFESDAAEKDIIKVKEDQQKRDMARLNAQYEEERERVLDELIKTTPAQKLELVKNEVASEIKEQYGNNFRFAETLGRRKFQDKLLSKANFPSREKWIKDKKIADRLKL